MDPISSIGIAAAIAQFVGLGLKVVTRLKEYSSATADVPKPLSRISSQLPLLLRSLERINTSAEIEKVDINTRCILKGVVAGCMQQVEKIDRIIDKVLRVPGDSLIVTVHKVFVSLRNDERVLTIEKNLQTYISILILHRVIEGPDLSVTANDDLFYFEVRVKKASPFFDRVELQEIEAHLQLTVASQAPDPVFIALVGQESVGKTQLALEYCYQANAIGQFQTIFWLDGANPQNLTRSLESVSDVIRRSKEGLKNGEEKVDFVKSFLSKRWHPWLLVLDNYNPAQFQDIKEFLPSQGSGAILLTTRYDETLVPARIVRVPKFQSPEELEQQQSSLVWAVRTKDVDRIKVLLDDGVDPNSRDGFGQPCLHRAIDDGNEVTAKLLIARGASIKVQAFGSDIYSSALYRTALVGNFPVAEFLLDEEDAAECCSPAHENIAVLGIAASNGHADIVNLLIKRRVVDLNGKDESSETALGLACKNGHTSVVKILLDHKADVEAKSNGVTPLTWAAKNNHLDVVKLLCGQGVANVNAGDLTSRMNQPPLWHATCAAGASNEVVKFLLESGADPNRWSKNQTSPLHEAVGREYENVVSILLRHGADPYPSECDGHTPICDAACYGYEKMIPLFLQSTSQNPTAQKQQQEDALLLASTRGHRAIILLLLDAGVNINALDTSTQMTPLLHAINEKRTPTARLLLRRGASLESPTNHSLHLAAEKGLDLIVKEILRITKTPDLRNSDGAAPLCVAAAKGHEKIVQTLLENGADPHLTNRFGDSPLDLAMDGGHEEVVRVLEEGMRTARISNLSASPPLSSRTG